MQKKAVAHEPWTPEEVRFIALPGSDDLKRHGASEEDLRVYRNAQWQILRAQEKCAVLATKTLRPDEYALEQRVYRDACARARHERNKKLLAVFSETCTKGL